MGQVWPGQFHWKEKATLIAVLHGMPTRLSCFLAPSFACSLAPCTSLLLRQSSAHSSAGLHEDRLEGSTGLLQKELWRMVSSVPAVHARPASRRRAPLRSFPACRPPLTGQPCDHAVSLPSSQLLPL